MDTYHVTRRRFLDSILCRGLLCRKATGKRKAVWLVSRCRKAWAVEHVCRRHGVGLEELVVLQVRVDRKKLRGHLRGTWYSMSDVPACCILSVSSFQLVSLEGYNGRRNVP